MLMSPKQPRRDWDTGEEGSLIGRGILDEMENEAQHIPFFTKLFTLSQVVGILSVVLVGVWCGYFRGGFAWFNDPTLQFNWHPFLMTLGLVFFYANGAMIYRGFRSEKKKKLKILHMLIQLSAFIFSIVGLVAVFDFHNKSHPPIPNMYSLHSWVGLCTVILFACQWLVGLLHFPFSPVFRPPNTAAALSSSSTGAERNSSSNKETQGIRSRSKGKKKAEKAEEEAAAGGSLSNGHSSTAAVIKRN
nr:transmembrane ascorbate-dependent reductase CYB561-like [Cherax quadricarinatus]